MNFKDFMQKFKDGGLAAKIITSLLLGSAGGFILFYIFLPPINLRSVAFWLFLAAVIFLYTIPFLGLKIDNFTEITKSFGKVFKKNKVNVNVNKWLLLPTFIPIVVVVFGLIISSELFNARSYAKIIEVDEDADFASDLPETNEITNIALMDTDSAMMLGNRTLGSLSEFVSQYTLSSAYTQINYKNTPKKVTNLEYDGFFKWLGNRERGIPGMVMVDPVKSSSEYVKFDETIKYVESGFFGDDLQRKLRFSYPTKIFDHISFEIDESGKPYFIVACSKPTVALFGASDISEVIIFNPADGSSEIRKVADAPSWIDIVYDGYLATDKYNWYGTLSGGFINSIIGNVGCKQATDDFGYIVLGDDVWYFTGVTSAVSDDKSNIGFILTNARTGEYKFYSVIGAEEHSAMDAAAGAVQEKGYVASFPSLVNVSGQATYIMVLKDNAGLVKLYALVNVENYSIVATGQTQADAMSSYKKLLKQNNIDTGADTDTTLDITVKDVRIVMVSDVATVYISATDGNVYKGYLEADEALILVEAGDELTVSVAPTEISGIFSISSWSFKEATE